MTDPTGTVPRAAPTATPLTRERIVDACVLVADTEGPAAVTLRRLGRELGVDATAVYRHFRDKDEILRAAADRLLSETLDGIVISGRWQDDLRHLAVHVRRVHLAHPGLSVLVNAATEPLPSEARVTEAGLEILRTTGLPAERAVALFEVLQDYGLALTGIDVARAEAARAGATADPWRRQFAALPPDVFPNLAASGHLLYRNDDARFFLGLDLLIEAIEARLEASAGA